MHLYINKDKCGSSPLAQNAEENMSWIQLTAEDGHRFDAYEHKVEGAVGGVVVLQEMFGVNEHIRSVVDRFAAAGYSAIAPALFDRQQRDYQTGYSPEEIAASLPLLKAIDWSASVKDVAAAQAHLKSQGLKTSVVGFCFGGSLAYLAATRLEGVASAVGYYGGYIAKVSDEVPNCPTMLHYGATDQTIPLSDVEAVAEARPEVDVFIYDAGHGFNCDARASFDSESAALAWDRTMALLAKTIG